MLRQYLEAAGWYVQDTSQTDLGFDLLIHKHGRTVPVEVKDGDKPISKQALTPHEAAVHQKLKVAGVDVVLLTRIEDVRAILERPMRAGDWT